jgi:hypothetical protein
MSRLATGALARILQAQLQEKEGMQIKRWHVTCGSALLLALSSFVIASAQGKQDDKYRCSEANPPSQCDVTNTCGSASTTCMVNVRRSGSSVSVTPTTPQAKSNELFCIRTGTTVTWHSSSKGTGFLVDFGPSSPFDPPDTIMGGSKKAISVRAARPGCFQYAFQATKSAAIKGMSEASRAELVVLDEK